MEKLHQSSVKKRSRYLRDIKIPDHTFDEQDIVYSYEVKNLEDMTKMFKHTDDVEHERIKRKHEKDTKEKLKELTDKSVISYVFEDLKRKFNAFLDQTNEGGKDQTNEGGKDRLVEEGVTKGSDRTEGEDCKEPQANAESDRTDEGGKGTDKRSERPQGAEVSAGDRSYLSTCNDVKIKLNISDKSKFHEFSTFDIITLLRLQSKTIDTYNNIDIVAHMNLINDETIAYILIKSDKWKGSLYQFDKTIFNRLKMFELAVYSQKWDGNYDKLPNNLLSSYEHVITLITSSKWDGKFENFGRKVLNNLNYIMCIFDIIAISPGFIKWNGSLVFRSDKGLEDREDHEDHEDLIEIFGDNVRNDLDFCSKVLECSSWNGSCYGFGGNVLNNKTFCEKVISSENFDGNFEMFPCKVLQQKDIRCKIANRYQVTKGVTEGPNR